MNNTWSKNKKVLLVLSNPALVVHARRNEKKSGETRGLSRNVVQPG